MLLDRGADLEVQDKVSLSPLDFGLAVRGPESSAPSPIVHLVQRLPGHLAGHVVFALHALPLQPRLWLEHFPCRSAVAAMPCCRMAGPPSIGAGWTLASVRC